MKKNYCLFLICFLLGYRLQAQMQPAQNWELSPIKLSTGLEGDSLTTGISSKAILILNSQTRQFTADAWLTPLLNQAVRDSLNDVEDRLFRVHFEGQLPGQSLQNIDFLSPGSSGASYTINGTMTLNGVSMPYALNFSVAVFQSAIPISNGNNASSIYPARVFFVMQLNPINFGLDDPAIGLTRPIALEVSSGLVNRTR